MHDQSWQQEVAQSSIVEPACIALYRYVEDELGSRCCPRGSKSTARGHRASKWYRGSIGSAAETAKRKNTMPSIAKGQSWV
jgi:hypothetical protein